VTQLALFHASLLLVDADVPFPLTSADNPFPSAIAIYSAGYEM
jgi:hypothetical protein